MPSIYNKTNGWKTAEIITADKMNDISNTLSFTSEEIYNAVEGGPNVQKQNDTLARKLDGMVKYFNAPPNPEDLQYTRLYVEPANESITVPTIEDYTTFKKNFVSSFSKNNNYAVGKYIEYNDTIYKVIRAIAANNEAVDDATAWTTIATTNPSPIREINVMQELDNLISVYTSEDQLTNEQNRIWIESESDEFQIPTMIQFNQLKNRTNGKIDLLNGIAWESGSINGGNGLNETNAARIRTAQYIDVSSYQYVDINIVYGYKFTCLWLDEYKEPLRATGWQQRGYRYDMHQQGAKYARLVVADNSNGTAPLDYAQYIVFHGINESEMEREKTLKNMSAAMTSSQMLILNDWINVGRNVAGNDTIYGTRCSTLEKVVLRAGDIVSVRGVLSEEGQQWIVQGTNGTNWLHTLQAYTATEGGNITIPADGTYWVTIKKVTGGSDKPISWMDVKAQVYIIPNDFLPLQNHIKIEELSTQIEELTQQINNMSENMVANKNLEPLYIGTFQQGAISASGDIASQYRISSNNTIGLPMGSDRRIIGHINEAYVLGIRTGVKATDLNHALYFYTGDFTINIPEGDNYYRLYIARNTGSSVHDTDTIAPLTAEQMGLALYWVKKSDILTENREAEKLIAGARLKLGSRTGTSTPNTMNELAVIAHTSDPHGDYERVRRFFAFSEKIRVDAACVTGDIVAYEARHKMDWFKELANQTTVLPAICVGNHEAQGGALSDEDIYDLMFDGLESKIGNTTGKTWYYQDIPDKKLRLISVNLYQDGSQTEQGGYRYHTHLLSDQISFLIDALSTTPGGYGVLMLEHAPQVGNDQLITTGFEEFYQAEHSPTGAGSTHNDITGGYPIYDLVDAFIGRTAINRTYTQKGTPNTVIVQANFASVDNSVEFIAHLTGHMHTDAVGYIPNTAHRQLMLNVVCTMALRGGTINPYMNDATDIGRDLDDATQDSFNIYAIDRAAKEIRIVRVGGNVTYKLTKREKLIASYADIP